MNLFTESQNKMVQLWRCLNVLPQLTLYFICHYDAQNVKHSQKQKFLAYLLKRETTWNHLKQAETIWNHLKPAMLKYFLFKISYSQVAFFLVLHPKVLFGQIWSQKLKFSKFTEIWYRHPLLYPFFEFKACVRYFLTNFYLSPNDSPSKTMKDVFYFIWKALFVLGTFDFLCFHLPLFFSLSAITLVFDPR